MAVPYNGGSHNSTRRTEWSDINRFSKRKKTAAVILAGGSSARMNGLDKLSAEIDGISVLMRSILAFEQNPDVDEIILVVREDKLANLPNGLESIKKLKVAVKGGATRTESAYNGVMAVSQSCSIIMIHDAARPLVSQKTISEAAGGAKKYGAALPAVQVKDTVKMISNGFVASTPDRNTVYAAQTPQAFRSELIKAALTNALQNKLNLTDDCAAVEKLGMKVFVTAGDYENIKITTSEDLAIAEAILKRKNLT